MRGFVADKKKSKIYKTIDPDEIAKALGAKRITDPKEIEEFKKKYGWKIPPTQTSKDKK